MEKYYIGLDMGTNSVGWAVTDENYRIVRKKGKDLWGVRLFEEAKPSAERRSHRVSRRRLEREKRRIAFLKEVFAEEINKVDPGFYQRMADSKYFTEDKHEQQKYALFADKDYTDEDYYKEFPTIFHLRKALIENKKQYDVRLVFLALLNMYKHRGHFLNASLDSSDNNVGIDEIINGLKNNASEILEIEISSELQKEWLEEILTNRKLTASKKSEEIINRLNLSKKDDKAQIEMWKLVCGLTGKLANLYDGFVALDEENKGKSINFKSASLDEDMDSIVSLIGDEYAEILYSLKQLHDYGVLANILNGRDYLSYSRVEAYEKHAKDLKILKHLFMENSVEEYNKMFRVMADNNYSAYAGSVNSKEQKARRGGTKKEEDFFKQVEKIVKGFNDSEEKEYVLNEIALGNFLPKQLTASNGIIPNQVHKKEMKKILDNAKTYLPFLGEIDESGLELSERIIKMFEFQLPYFVGPISPIKGLYSKNVWSKRIQQGQIYPWNFEEKIDVKESAENFITRMVNKCTYLNNEMVLPKNSLLYEKYMLLNELNNLKVNGVDISVELKQRIYNELFRNGKKVTGKAVVKYLKNIGAVSANEEPVITGIDGDFTNRRANYAKFADGVFKVETMTYEQEQIAENIIRWATLYGDTKSFLKEKINENYGDILTKEQIKRVLGYKFKDWGRLSKELLFLEGADKDTGEIDTVYNRMWNGNYNLAELVAGNRFTYKEIIEEKSRQLDKSLSEIEFEDLYEISMSAPVRRMTWQTILILKEICQVMGGEPAKVFVEMAKGPDEKKERSVSRKKKFLELYKSCKTDRDWIDEISKKEEADFRSKKLYLYYTQMGRCMYTGEVIDLENLFNDNLYDIDHIYPQKVVKDDSLDRNMVLVRKTANAHKSDVFPLESDIRNKQVNMWRSLKDGGFISEEKFKRLTRATTFTDEELVGFISRQIVETRQATKLVTNLIKDSFEEAEVVYVKAGNVSDFRHEYSIGKCRAVNDYHHAKDAYLNIVVGNVYDVKFTKNPYRFIVEDYKKDAQRNHYHMNKIFRYDVQRGDNVAWIAKDDMSISIVKKMVAKHTPLVTVMTLERCGSITNKQTLYSADDVINAEGKGYIPFKASDEKLQDVYKYGGFKDVAGSYFFVVEHVKTKGKKSVTARTVEQMPIYLRNKYTDEEGLIKYCEDILGYTQVKVICSKIKIQSLIKVNGFYYYITGRSGDSLLITNAVQLALSEKMEDYIKDLCKFDENKVWTKDLREKITEGNNIELYDELTKLHSEGIYSRRSNGVGERLNLGRDKFINCSIENQIYTILQIIKLSQRDNRGVDFTFIGFEKTVGKMRLSKNIIENEEIKLVNTSITGIYRKEVDLLK